MKRLHQVISIITCLVLQAEEVAWQQSTIPFFKSLPNLKLSGALLRVSISVFSTTTGNQKSQF